MPVLKSFRLLSSVVIIIIIIIVGASPFHSNAYSLDLHNLRYEETEIPDVYRLPNDVIPVSYELKMVPDLEKFTFAGQVNITIRVQFTTDRIILHSKDLTIENVAITETKGCVGNATISIPATHSLDDENEILIIQKTTDKFMYNTNYKISIEFRGTLKYFPKPYTRETRPGGFYRAFYKINNQTRWLAITQFESTSARRAFPCFDEFRFKAPFTVYLARTENQIAVSNMPNETTDLLPADSLSNGLGYEKFQQTPLIPTYLLAFMVSDFKILKDENQDARIRVIARPNAIQNGQYALTQATKLLKYFEGYFGIPYPLPKLDLVAVPDYPGGMENFGMTTYGELYSILEKNSAFQKFEITTVISHEFAHLWFGDLVTPAWFDYLWLKEGFAGYFQYFATAAIEPTWNIEEVFVGWVTQYTFSKDDSDVASERAITWPIRKAKDIDASYNAVITYYKASILIRMFELISTPKTFESALRRYLKDGQRYLQGVAVQKNLFDVFDEQVELDSVSHLPPHVHASDIMRTWSENIGYPLITVTRSYEQGEVNVIQIPYPGGINSADVDSQYQDQQWIVPLTFTTKSQSQFSNLQPIHWSFAKKPTRLTGFEKSGWILFNLKRSAYYRVNYDSKNWHLLIDQLLENHTKIHVLNRAQLIDDVFTLAKDQLIDCRIAGRLMKYLQNETSIAPWFSASQWFLNLISETMPNSISRETLKKQLKTFLEKPLKHIGCTSPTTEDELTSRTNSLLSILSNQVGIRRCAQELSQTHQKNYKIPQNLKQIVFCDALRHTDNPTANFEHLWNTYKKSNEIYEKKQILEAIFSCSNDEGVIKSVLSKIIDPENEEISQQEVSFILKGFPSKIPAVTATIKFIDERIPTLSNLDENGIKFLASLLNSINLKIRTEEQIELVKKMKIKFESLERKKYVEYSEIIKNLRIIDAEKKIQRDTKFKELFPNECLFSDETSAI